MRIIQIIWQLIQRHLLNRAMNERLDDDVCAACESSDLTRLAEGAYRCNHCGYEGGSNFAAYKQRKERERADQLSETERRDRGLAELEEARDSIQSGLDMLQSAKKSGLYDLVGMDDPTLMAGGGDSKYESLLESLQYFREGEKLVDDAAYKLDLDVPEHLYLEEDFDELDGILDGFLDSLPTDLLSQAKLDRIESNGLEFRNWIEDRLGRLR